jgi:hypothetical protein
LEEVPSYKYLTIDIHPKPNWNYSIDKRINGGWKYYYGLGNKCKLVDLWLWTKRNSSLILPSLMLDYMYVKFGDVLSLENPGERYNKCKRILSLIISKLKEINPILSSL